MTQPAQGEILPSVLVSTVTSDTAPSFRNEPANLLPYLLAGPVLGLLSVVVYALAEGGLTTFGIGLLIGLAALLVGGVLGFIFAIPRAAAAATTTAGRLYRSNSNLEEISDWFTKILVGLGLAQFRTIVDGAQTLVDSLASALGDAASSAAFAGSVLVIFGASGFLGAYILTRVYLGPIFAQSEEAMKEYVDEAIDQKVEEKLASFPEHLRSR